MKDEKEKEVEEEKEKEVEEEKEGEVEETCRWTLWRRSGLPSWCAPGAWRPPPPWTPGAPPHHTTHHHTTPYPGSRKPVSREPGLQAVCLPAGSF